ncbi:MAG TPA: hypothetical protein VND93_28305 [Myxococcales bacterium]|nr:hypothetical protein [Myxococcales bacterium]
MGERPRPGPGPLSEAFVASAPPSLRPGLRHLPDLEARLDALVHSGRSAWPGVALEPAAYLQHAASQLESAEPEALERLAAADLYLACACGHGLPAALEAFDRELLPLVLRAIKRVHSSREFLEDVKQAVRQRLFVPGAGGARPKILDYAGRGPLEGWLRAAALRIALNMRRGPQPVTVPEEALLQAPSAARDPELELIRARYGDAFRECLREAVALLPAEDRNMLRLHLTRGVEVRALARHYRLHRTTVSRRLATARDALVEETRRLLLQRLKLTRSEMKAMVKVLASQLELDISHVLGPRK